MTTANLSPVGASFRPFITSFQDLDNYPSEKEGHDGIRALQIVQETKLRERPYMVLRYSGYDHLPGGSPHQEKVIGWEVFICDIDNEDPQGLARHMLDVAYEPVGRPPAVVDADWHKLLTDWIVDLRTRIAVDSDE